MGGFNKLIQWISLQILGIISVIGLDQVFISAAFCDPGADWTLCKHPTTHGPEACAERSHSALVRIAVCIVFMT